jgi:hypothetical protein
MVFSKETLKTGVGRETCITIYLGYVKICIKIRDVVTRDLRAR